MAVIISFLSSFHSRTEKYLDMSHLDVDCLCNLKFMIPIISYSNDVVQCDVTFIEIKDCLKMHLDHVAEALKLNLT